MGEVNTRLPSSTCPKVFSALRNVTRVPAGNRGCLETFRHRLEVWFANRSRKPKKIWELTTQKYGIEPKITCRFSAEKWCCYPSFVFSTSTCLSVFSPHLCYSNLYCLSPDLPFKLLPNQKIRLLQPNFLMLQAYHLGLQLVRHFQILFAFEAGGARNGAIPGHTSETCLALPGKNIRCLPANRYVYIYIYRDLYHMIYSN